MSTIPTEDNIFELPKYRSILNLLIGFQRHKGGLEAKHLRYALIKNHDNLDKKTSLKAFYGNALDEMIKQGHIERDCISSKYNLNKKLNTLWELGVISYKYRKKRRVYTINKKFLKEGIRIFNKEVIDEYPIDEISYVDDGTFRRYIIYGLEEETFKSNSREIKKHLQEINKHIMEIEKFKDREWECWWREKLFRIDEFEGTAFDEMDIDKFIKFVDENSDKIYLAFITHMMKQLIKRTKELYEEEKDNLSEFERRKIQADINKNPFDVLKLPQPYRDFIDKWSIEHLQEITKQSYEDCKGYYDMIGDASAGREYEWYRGITLSKQPLWNIPHHTPIEDAILRDKFIPLIE
jgi:hypothetical protein